MKQGSGNNTVLDRFPGMVDAADPNDLPPGAAQVQINLSSAVPGELRSRTGYLPVTFESSSTESV